MVHWHPALRLLIAVVITVGITLLAVKIFREPIMDMDAKDEVAADEHETLLEEARRTDPPGEMPPPLPPKTTYLAQRVIGLTTSAFVFLLAFTLSSYWSAAKDARTATLSEATYWAQSVATASELPKSPETDRLQQALLDYRDSVIHEQWPDMQAARTEGVQKQEIDARAAVGKAVLAADQAGAGKSPLWSQLVSSVDSMFDQANSRLDTLPNPSAPGVLMIIGLLGIVNLALIVVFQASRMGTNMFLAGTLAAVTALLLFIVVETSNAYVGGTAIKRPTIMTETIRPADSVPKQMESGG